MASTSTTATTLRLFRAHPISRYLSLTPAHAMSSLDPMERGSCYHSAELLLISAFHDGMARLSRPRAIVCKFPVHKNYVVTQVSATGFESGASLITNPLRCRWATTLTLFTMYKWNGFACLKISVLRTRDHGRRPHHYRCSSTVTLTHQHL